MVPLYQTQFFLNSIENRLYMQNVAKARANESVVKSQQVRYLSGSTHWVDTDMKQRFIGPGEP